MNGALGFLTLWLMRLGAIVLIIVTLCFIMVEMLPGDRAFQIAGARYDVERVTPAIRDEVHRELGLDRPAIIRLVEWGAMIASGNFGRSIVSGENVVSQLTAASWRTLALMTIAWPASIVLGVVGGLLLSGSTRRLALAKLIGALSSGTPTFVVGLAFVSLFAIQWQWLPAAGYGGLAYLVLPAATLAVRAAARLSLIVAVSVASAAQHPSIAFAHMKGVGRTAVAVKHVLPLAAPPIVAFAFVSLAAHLTGVVIIEQLFAYPGLGKLLVDSVIARDVPMVQAIAILFAVLIVTCNTLADFFARRLSTGAAE